MKTIEICCFAFCYVRSFCLQAFESMRYVGLSGVQKFILPLSLAVLVGYFQAEGGIRAHCVTGVQTCALPISNRSRGPYRMAGSSTRMGLMSCVCAREIGRASCRERVWI